MSLLLKPEFHSLSPLRRVLCFGLILEADNTGKGSVHHAAPRGIIAAWRSSCRRSWRRMLPHLAAVRHVLELHYWEVDRELFWCLPNFHKYQKLKYIGASRYPCCPRCGCDCRRQCSAAASGMRSLKREKKRFDGRVATFSQSEQRPGDEDSRGPIASTVDQMVHRMRRKIGD